MTDPAGKFWSDTRGVYKQPRVINPPAMQNANGARHAIWHFGRMLELLVYVPDQHVWRASDESILDDGRHERGIPLVLQVRGTFQPNTQKRGRGVMEDVSGGRSEDNYILHIDSHDPVNLKATCRHRLLFPNGLRLADFDDLHEATGVNFPMAVRFRGNTYKIKQPISLWAGGDEEMGVDGAIYRADCQLWRDRHQERDGRGSAPVWGPTGT